MAGAVWGTHGEWRTYDRANATLDSVVRIDPRLVFASAIQRCALRISPLKPPWPGLSSAIPPVPLSVLLALAQAITLSSAPQAINSFPPSLGCARFVSPS